jgi:glycosyltransferase involved in cell wall biosynthesis
VEPSTKLIAWTVKGEWVRILFVNKFWTPSGGVEEHCRQLVEMLEGEGHEIVRFGMEDPDNEPPLPTGQSVSAVSFHDPEWRERLRAASRACLGRETRVAMRKLVERERFDVAHVVHAYHQLGMTFLPILRDAGLPIIMDLHDYKVGCPRYLLFNDRTREVCTVCLDRRGGWLWAPAARRCWNGSRLSGALLTAEALSARLARAYSAADRVVVRSELQVAAAERGGVPREKIRLIRSWLEERPERERNPGAPMLFVGRLVKEKGVETLIRAAAKSRIAVRVVGDGPQRPELENLIAATGADVELAGWRTHDEVLDEMSRARALVVPSIWHETFGLVVAEAFASGTPVIASRLGAVSELLDEERGYLFPAGDSDRLADLMTHVTAHPREAAGRVDNAMRYAHTHLTFERWRHQYLEIYRELDSDPALSVGVDR